MRHIKHKIVSLEYAQFVQMQYRSGRNCGMMELPFYNVSAPHVNRKYVSKQKIYLNNQLSLWTIEFIWIIERSFNPSPWVYDLINSAPMTVIATTTMECGTGPQAHIGVMHHTENRCVHACGWVGAWAQVGENCFILFYLFILGQRVYICNTSATCHGKHATRITGITFQKSQCSSFEVTSMVYCVHAKSYCPQFLRKQ